MAQVGERLRLEALIKEQTEYLECVQGDLLPFYEEANVSSVLLVKALEEFRAATKGLVEAYEFETRPSKRERDADALGEEIFDRRRDDFPWERT